MRIQVQVSLRYGVLFLSDPYGDPEIPADTGAAPITSTSTCICLQVASYVDGDANVILSDKSYSDDVNPTFSRKIASASKYVSVTDVAVNYYCILRLMDEYADINIWEIENDDDRMSWVQVKNLETF